ncbi:MAG: sensor histidine kinase [Syntrophomonadaceae bacterium]|nr:sensor histidine kinase [Syntrophomonadaceae bacterium]
MDTKSKNISHFKWTKLLAIIIVWLGFLGTMGGCFYYFENREIANSSSYTDTYSFQNSFARLLHNTVEYHVILKSEDNIKNSGEDLPTQAENLQRFQLIENRLADMVNFVYYVRNTETGETWSNLGPEKGDPVSYIQKQPANAFFNGWTSNASISMAENVEDMMSGSPYEVYAAVAKPLQAGDLFYDDYMDYTQTKARSNAATDISIISFILMAIAFIYLIYITGRREPEGEVVPARTDRMYSDVHTVLVLIAAILSLFIAPGTSIDVPNVLSIIAIAVVLSLDIFIGLFYVLSMVEQIKTGQIFTNTLLYKLGSALNAFLRQAFQGKVFKAWILLLLLGYGFINGLLFILCAEAYFDSFGGFLFMLLLLLGFNAGAIYFAARSLVALPQIMEAVKEISAGNLDYPLNSTLIPASLAAFAEDIRSLQGGLKKAVAAAVKGERMKTDLITNVSHDLKTPLTSIINYVDLLKKENLENEAAAEYINVLEEKSSRLKQLIEDLMEASKASSGNLAVAGEKVDLQELMMQACGEYEEKIQKAQLELHIQAADAAVVVRADGKHMWRIAENLLSNVIKYSMPHSRVYVDIASDNAYGSFTVKNISAFPLNIMPEQLTERFVRGDESRSTEGSGLGLSIAQSLSDLQGGTFQLEIDGDLFKATVAIPLWAEE